VDDTAPSWLQEHPNSPRIYAVASGDFYAKIAVDGYFPDDPMQILPALVEAYNHSGNPGRFELRSMNHESFDIIPTAAADGPQKAHSRHGDEFRLSHQSDIPGKSASGTWQTFACRDQALAPASST
jgi:hypothetical protein